MLNFFELPLRASDFIQEKDYKNFVTEAVGHNWLFLKAPDMLTDYAYNWFQTNGFKLGKEVLFFKISKDFVGGIHCDHVEQRFAFNFILDGQGEMQWVANVVADESEYNGPKGRYPVFRDVKSFDIIDRWSGKMALVRTHIPHRIVNTGVDRYCVSIRPENPKSFDDALARVQHINNII